MQAPVVLSDATMENEEAVYPCKGCGEILEEGKAFELAGNRWHIDCFRCNTCGTLLDSDANLLLLGDGSLICNNCTYSCSACGNKIEDLAILTGDQAFCANCFKCRNCKRKIDNLRYARTSQGIFCMQCHESLMARRRKRTKGMPRTTSTNSNGSGPVVLDKSLPALPPHAVPTGVFQPESEAMDTYDSPPQSAKREISLTVPKRGHSPSSDAQKVNTVLPSSTYSDGHSLVSPQTDMSTPIADDDFFIPVTLDSADSIAPLAKNKKGSEQAPTRDYFAGSKHTSVAAMRDEFQDLVAGSSRSGSTERSQSRQRRSPLVAPHIASQQRGRKSSGDIMDTLRRPYDPDTDAGSSTTSPTATGLDQSLLSPSYEPTDSTERDGFKLQDAPRSRPAASRQDSKQSLVSTSSSRDVSGAPMAKESSDTGRINSPAFFDAFDSLDPVKRSNSIRRARSPAPSPATLGGSNPYDRPARDDSLFKQPSVKQTVQRKEVPRPEGDLASETTTPTSHERKASGSSLLGWQESKLLPGKNISRQYAPVIATTLADGPPARSPRRPNSAKPEDDSDAPTPRSGHIAPPSSEQRHRPTASVSSIQSENFSANDTFAAPSEDDINRMLPSEHQGLFRRVSKAVKHGRSHSEKNNVVSPSWKRNGSADIGSPPVGSLDPREEVLHTRNKLRVSQQRVAELEAEKSELQERVNGNVDLRSLNIELREKRSTMAFLDTQREMVIRELEVMTEHLSKVKDSRVPLDMENLQAVVMRDFAASLQKLKDSLGSQIEDLMRKKNDTTSQLSNLSQMKDKAYQEYEILSTRNNQLTENNQQLLLSMQESYKQNRQPSTSSYATTIAPQQNGLGIYPNHTQSSITQVDSSATSQFSGDTEVGSQSGLNGTKVVDIQKAQPKKFNWKKGGQTVAKNMTKGIKGAFSSTQTSTLREEQFAEGLPYGSIPSGELPAIGTSPFAPSKGNDPGRQWNFLSATGTRAPQAPKPPVWGQREGAGISSTSLAIVSLPADTTIFGSDLTARCDFEKRIIPAIVSHCIEEVEARGITLEGIYRKSGSASQVKTIQIGFEKDLNYDISDPDLDVHAVTSALKQYFRKLPNPLITFEVYDALLEAAGGDGPPTSAQGMGMGGMGVGLGAEKGTRAEEEEKARRVKEVVDTLPTSHRETLEFLIDHLVRVMAKESENLMTPLNIAVVFAPTIMRPQSIEREMTDMQAQRAAVQLMLEQSRIVFGDEDE